MKRAVSTDPAYAWGWRQLAAWQHDAGNYAGELDAAEATVRLSPHDPTALAGLAVLLVSAVTPRFQVDGLLAAVTFAVLLSVFSIALSTLVPQSIQGGDDE